MKKKLLSLAILLISFCIFSTTIFAQTAPGDDGTGGGGTPPDGGGTGGTPPPPAPMVYTFKRNNGNGLGVCGGNAQIRVAFSPMPDPNHIPIITEIWYNDGKNGAVKIISVATPVYGDMVDKTQPYVSYCLHGIIPSPGNSQGNINPAVKLTLVFGMAPTTPANGTDNGIEITN